MLNECIGDFALIDHGEWLARQIEEKTIQTALYCVPHAQSENGN